MNTRKLTSNLLIMLQRGKASRRKREKMIKNRVCLEKTKERVIQK